MLDLYLPLWGFIVVMVSTPGPANMLLMLAGAMLKRHLAENLFLHCANLGGDSVGIGAVSGGVMRRLVLMKFMLMALVAFGLMLGAGGFASAGDSSDGFSGFHGGEGSFSRPDGFGGYKHSDGSYSRPDGFGGYRHSDGSYSRPDGFGGFRHSDGSYSRPDGFGGFTHSDGSYSRPDGFGGFTHIE